MVDAFCPCPMCRRNRAALRGTWGQSERDTPTVDMLLHGVHGDTQPEAMSPPKEFMRLADAMLKAREPK